eukprot:3427234-Rhodomonas_salina.1
MVLNKPVGVATRAAKLPAPGMVANAPGIAARDACPLVRHCDGPSGKADWNPRTEVAREWGRDEEKVAGEDVGANFMALVADRHPRIANSALTAEGCILMTERNEWGPKVLVVETKPCTKRTILYHKGVFQTGIL